VIEPLYVAARGVLLDALDALGEQREALILAGAQAIYIHTGAADLAVAEFTTDGDLVVNPEQLKAQPRLSEAMERALFRSGLQPGSWLCDRTVSGIATTIPVDLLVPEAVAGSGRRAARPKLGNPKRRSKITRHPPFWINPIHRRIVIPFR